MKTKFFVLLAASVALWLVMLFIAIPPKLPTVPSKLNPIVRLVYEGHTFCSGTVIGPNTIVTAAHCVVQQDMFGGARLADMPIEIRPYHNITIGVYGKAYWATTQLDQALIKGDFALFEPKPYISDIATIVKIQQQRRKLISCGYPLSGDLYCSELAYERLLTFFMSAHGTLLPGMSGGPTMLEDGTMIAVNTAVTDDLSIISPIYNIDKNIK